MHNVLCSLGFVMIVLFTNNHLHDRNAGHAIVFIVSSEQGISVSNNLQQGSWKICFSADLTKCIYLLTSKYTYLLTHRGRVTHICVGNTTIIGSDDGLSPGRRQAINWTNTGILSIGPLGTNFSENVIEIHISSLKKMHLKMSSGK